MPVLLTLTLVVSGGCVVGFDEVGELARCIHFGGVYHPATPTHPAWCDLSKSAGAGVVGRPLFIGATAHVAGALGTNWRSDVEIHNLGREIGAVTVSLLVHGADNSSPDIRELEIGPGESLRLEDVLASEFVFDGQAALAVVPSSARILMTSRTYNLLGPDNDLGLPVGATFGQSIPATSWADALGFGDEGRIIQLEHDDAFRTNLALVNSATSACRVETDLYASDGTLLGSIATDLAPLEYRQINRVFERVAASTVSDGYAVLRTTSQAGHFFAFASVVDNLTGDPVAINAIRTGALVPGEPIYVVASAHVRGAAGTNWRTDLEVHNPEPTEVSFSIELLVHGTGNPAPEIRQYTLGPGRSRRFADVLDAEFGREGQAALRITCDDGRVMVTSRTYNLLEAGNDLGLPAGATFGQFIAGVGVDQAVRFGGEARLIQLTQSPAGEGFRSNLVLVNAGASETNVEIDLHDADGTYLGTVTRALEPFEYRQINRLFELGSTPTVDDGYAVVRTTTPNGRFFALASVVDNLTGDPVGMMGAEILPPTAQMVVDGVEAMLDDLGGTSIEGLADGLALVGVGAVLDALVDVRPEFAERTGSGMLVDYGDGSILWDGTLAEGSVAVDASGLEVSEGGVTGAVTVQSDGLLYDGEPPPITSGAAIFELDRRVDRSVVGTVTFGPAAAGKDSVSISGAITIDTAICPFYPVEGSVTLDLGVVVLTINFSPDCDGRVEHDLEPVNVFSYAYVSPADENADDYVVSVDNAQVAQEGTVWYWRPVVGGETLAQTTPGVIIYHFPFDAPILSGRLRAALACWHWTYSQGRALLWASNDGTDWQLLDAIDAPPEIGGAISGGWNGDLPPTLLGAQDLWLKVELFSYGPDAPIGGIRVNTAQHSRWWVDAGPSNTFELEVLLGS